VSDDYRPREHDHLVEPVFGGLGVEPRRAGRLARLLARLRAFLARLRLSSRR